MKNKKRLSLMVVLSVAAFCFIGLTILLAFVNMKMFFASLIMTLIIIGFVGFNSVLLRSIIKVIFAGGDTGLSVNQRSVLLALKLPVLVTDATNNILWYNSLFFDTFLTKDVMLENVSDVIPNFNPFEAVASGKVLFTASERHYQVFAASVTQGDEYVVSYFVDDTELQKVADEFGKTRPSVLLVTIDNYEDVVAGLRESDKSALLADADRLLDDFINNTNGIMRKLSASHYFMIIEERHITEILEERFKILDSFRSLNHSGMSPTLSIGVGRGARTLYENQLFAGQALDMALGRGGDQAAVKTGKEFVFYGGSNREVERRKKIRARTIATALANLIKVSSNVIIVGHKMSDIDSVGSAIGLARLVTACGIPVNIAVDEDNTLAEPLIELMKQHSYERIFVSPHVSRSLVTPNTLLIVTDTQLEQRVDVPELVEDVENIVIIDHHRKAVNHIDKNVLFYHDTYASSCSELVCELIQFCAEDDATPHPHEALAMLAGIMLDTKNFTLRTGVRTFEASAYLRKLGAEPIEAKLLFATSFDVYKSKADIVSQSYVYRGCAISLCGRLPGELRLAVPQAADDMLNIDGINASIVAYIDENKVFISARSLGVYNVQLIMENMGGGGHLMMAGVQLGEISLDEAEKRIKAAIDKYIEEEQDYQEGTKE